MCILIVKPQNRLVPSREILKECFDRNPDGAGICYAKNNQIVLKKGFMTFEEFFVEANKIPTESSALIHCRIGTSGGNVPELTHPYPLTNNIKELKRTQMVIKGSKDSPKYAVGHNGIFYEYNNRDDGINDTCAFIANILYPLNISVSNLLDKNLDAIINKLVGTSKIAILRTDGEIAMFGDGWIEDNGIFYSNNTYKKITYTKYTWLEDDDYVYNRENYMTSIKNSWGNYKDYMNWWKMDDDERIEWLKKKCPSYVQDIDGWTEDGWTPIQMRNWLWNPLTKKYYD